jgi:hypothetical protein
VFGQGYSIKTLHIRCMSVTCPLYVVAYQLPDKVERHTGDEELALWVGIADVGRPEFAHLAQGLGGLAFRV